MLVLLYYFVCVDTCVVKYRIAYRIVVYLSDTASECVLQELPRAVVVDISICGVIPVLWTVTEVDWSRVLVGKSGVTCKLRKVF